MEEGEQTLYLSVPNENDWAKIKLMKAPYHKLGFTKCIYVSLYDIDGINKLVDKIVAIRALFNTITYEMAQNDNYYRINVTTASDLKTVDVEDPDRTKLKDQELYLNNYFKRKEDALKVLQEIKNILDINE